MYIERKTSILSISEMGRLSVVSPFGIRVIVNSLEGLEIIR